MSGLSFGPLIFNLPVCLSLQLTDPILLPASIYLGFRVSGLRLHWINATPTCTPCRALYDFRKVGTGNTTLVSTSPTRVCKCLRGSCFVPLRTCKTWNPPARASGHPAQHCSHLHSQYHPRSRRNHRQELQQKRPTTLGSAAHSSADPAQNHCRHRKEQHPR